MTEQGNTLSVFKAFNQNAVEYLVVGGTAVSYYGSYRPSTAADGRLVDKPDLDLWYNPSYANYFKLLATLETLGKDVTRYQTETTPNPRASFFRYEFDHCTIDLLPAICAPLRFAQALVNQHLVERGGVTIPFIGLIDLIRDKQALGRAKDLADIQNLRRANPGAGW